jgi:hypothetical protein
MQELPAVGTNDGDMEGVAAAADGSTTDGVMLSPAQAAAIIDRNGKRMGSRKRLMVTPLNVAKNILPLFGGKQASIG